MPARLIQIPSHIDSQDDPPSLTTHWRYVGSVSEFTVRGEVLLGTPGSVNSSMGTLYRQRVMLTQTAYNQWNIDITYGKRNTSVGSWSFDFDTTGGQAHINYSRESIARYCDPAEGVHNFPGSLLTGVPDGVEGGWWDISVDIPDHKGAIGVEKDDIVGIDIVVPALKFNIQFKHPAAHVSIPFMKLMADITGTVNLTKFFDFDPGEVLFLGCRGTDGSESEASVTYSFAAQPNEELEIGDVSVFAADLPALPASLGEARTIYGKRGWDVIWVKFKDDDDADHPVKIPQFVYVERVYNYVDLAAVLGFGG